jgi:hypothetical protein
MKRRAPAANTRLHPGEHAALHVDDGQGGSRGPVECGQEAVVVGQRRMPQGDRVRGTLGRDDHFGDRRQRRQIEDLDRVGAIAARPTRVEGRRHIDLLPPSGEQGHDRAVAAVDHAEESPAVDVDEGGPLQNQIRHPSPMRRRRHRQLFDLAGGLGGHVGVGGRGQQRGQGSKGNERRRPQRVPPVRPRVLTNIRFPVIHQSV